jgi:hypothetical protein
MTDKLKPLIATQLPKQFWKVRDSAVEHILSNSPIAPGLDELQAWIAIDGWDDLLAAWINEDVALNLKAWAANKFSDSLLRETESLEDVVSITDQMRVAYARATIRDAVEQSEGDHSPSVHSFPIERDDGERAVLGCTVEIHGQYGPVPYWHGIFADKDSFYKYLRENGFLLHIEKDAISDVEILSHWEKEKKPKVQRSKIKSLDLAKGVAKKKTTIKFFKFNEDSEASYPILYSGRRVLILDMSDDLEANLGHSICLWDKRLDLQMGWADKDKDGDFIGFTIYGMHEIKIAGTDLKELATDCLAQHLWTMEN